MSFSDEYLRETQTTFTKAVPYLMIVTINNMETMHLVIFCKVTFKGNIDLQLLVSVLQ